MINPKKEVRSRIQQARSGKLVYTNENILDKIRPQLGTAIFSQFFCTAVKALNSSLERNFRGCTCTEEYSSNHGYRG